MYTFLPISSSNHYNQKCLVFSFSFKLLMNNKHYCYNVDFFVFLIMPSPLGNHLRDCSIHISDLPFYFINVSSFSICWFPRAAALCLLLVPSWYRGNTITCIITDEQMCIESTSAVIQPFYSSVCLCIHPVHLCIYV